MTNISQAIQEIRNEQKAIEEFVEEKQTDFIETRRNILYFEKLEQRIKELRAEQFKADAEYIDQMHKENESEVHSHRIHSLAVFLRQFALRIVSNTRPDLSEENVAKLVDEL